MSNTTLTQDATDLSITEQADQPSRRNLVAKLLGGIGVAALVGCEAPAGAESNDLATVQSALSGSSSVRWCDTMTEQRALTGGTTTSSQNVCIRRGFQVPADGGGGVWLWTTDTTTPQSSDPKGGVLVVPTATPRTGCWKRLFSGALNVRWFGAKGDNADTANDVDAIRAAIALAATMSPAPAVFLPAGTYRLKNSMTTGAQAAALLLTNNIHLRGEGAASILFWPGTGGGDPMTFDMVLVHGDDVSITDLTFQGQNGNVSGTGYVQSEAQQHAAIDVWFVMGSPEVHRRLIIERCRFQNLFGFIAHDAGGEIRGARFANNMALFCGNGDNLNSYDAEHLDNVFFNAEGIESSGAKVQIRGNRMSGIGPVISVSGFQTGGPEFNTNQVTVADNVIDMTDTVNGVAGIVCGDAKDVTIVGNTVKNPPTVGIEIIGGDRITVTGNTVLRDRLPGQLGTASGIFANGASDSVFSANVMGCGGFQHFGIEGLNLARVVIQGNAIRGSLGDGIIIINSAEVTLANNDVYQGGNFGIELQNTAGALLVANRALGSTQSDLRVDAVCSDIRLSLNRYAASQLLGAVTYNQGNG